MVDEKLCTKCSKIKAITEFSKNHYFCKECNALLAKENRLKQAINKRL